MLELSERQWQKVVLDMFKIYGWRTAHFDASVRVVGKERTFVGDVGSKGFPDIIACRPKRIIFAELKSEKGRLSEQQKEWLALLNISDAETYVWRPSDYNDIQEVLK